MSVCSHSHKISVTVVFATYLFSRDKNREVATKTVSQLPKTSKLPRLLLTSMLRSYFSSLYLFEISFWSFLPCGSPVVWFLLFCSCACGVLITVAIGGPFFPSGWYPLHALGPLCRRGLLCDRIRTTYIYTLHAVFCFFFYPLPFFGSPFRPL